MEYIDALAVTDVKDMVDYIYSLCSITTLNYENKDKIQRILEKNKINGVLSIPKEYGMFIAS